MPLSSGGVQTGAVLLFMDITDRKKAELALEERTNFLDSLIEMSPLAVAVLNPDFRLRMCNRAPKACSFTVARKFLAGTCPA